MGYFVIANVDARNALLLVAGIFAFIIVMESLKYGYLWLRATTAGARVPLFSMVAMRLRRVNVHTVVEGYISSHKAGLQLTTDDLEIHFLAGGSVPRVINAMIEAKNAGVDMPFDNAAVIDLQGLDVDEAASDENQPPVEL